MIDEVDHRLEAWAGEVLPKVEVSFALPADAEKKSAVGFHLLQITPDAAARGVREPVPYKIKLGYLVTAWAEEAKEMHRLLGTLMFAAMEIPEWTVSAVESAPDWWRAMGVPVRPAFLLWIPVLRERPERRVPRVNHDLVLRYSPMRILQGRVSGPNDVAIMDATVELPGLHLATRTDHEGKFLFSAVPSDPPVGFIRVNAKGREKLITLERPLASDEPLRIQLKESEI